MKLKYILTVLLLTAWLARSQGTFIYDQQSTNLIEGGAPWNAEPTGQSFTPSISSINFVKLYLFYSSLTEPGATLYLNIRSDSINGSILGSSSPIMLPSVFFDTTNFLFSTAISLVPGTTYFLQLVQSGDNVSSYVTDGSYAGGSLIQNGNSVPGRNLWFQEGIIVVPEPSSVALALLGGGVLLYLRKRKRC